MCYYDVILYKCDHCGIVYLREPQRQVCKEVEEGEVSADECGNRRYGEEHVSLTGHCGSRACKEVYEVMGG